MDEYEAYTLSEIETAYTLALDLPKDYAQDFHEREAIPWESWEYSLSGNK